MPFPALLVRTFEFDNGTHVAPHTHRSAQLIYSVKGSLVIETSAERWYVPATRGVWMPAELSHSIRCFGDVQMKTAFVRPDRDLPDKPYEVEVGNALRELLIALDGLDTNAASVPAEQLLAVIRYLSTPVGSSALAIPIRSTGPINTIVETLLANPCDRTTLEAWSARIHLSTRTITRRFKTATGMSFSQWKQQVALLHAVNLLAEGQTISAVSEQLGYENPGSFIDLFRKRFGTTPGRYFAPDAAGRNTVV